MSSQNDVVSRLTDTSKYTGAHKQRFGEDGKGLGKVGREDIALYNGSTSSEKRDHTVTATVAQTGPRQVVKAKTDEETYGVKPKKVTLFQYANKHDKGAEFVLTKAKFPSWKQVDVATTALVPTGKPKMILDQNLKQIKALDEFEDKGRYLCITAFDFKKYEKAKFPLQFSA